MLNGESVFKSESVLKIKPCAPNWGSVHKQAVFAEKGSLLKIKSCLSPNESLLKIKLCPYSDELVLRAKL